MVALESGRARDFFDEHKDRPRSYLQEKPVGREEADRSAGNSVVYGWSELVFTPVPDCMRQ